MDGEERVIDEFDSQERLAQFRRERCLAEFGNETPGKTTAGKIIC